MKDQIQKSYAVSNLNGQIAETEKFRGTVTRKDIWREIMKSVLEMSLRNELDARVASKLRMSHRNYLNGYRIQEQCS